jgi:hypothetical protein
LLFSTHSVDARLCQYGDIIRHTLEATEVGRGDRPLLSSTLNAAELGLSRLSKAITLMRIMISDMSLFQQDFRLDWTIDEHIIQPR